MQKIKNVLAGFVIIAVVVIAILDVIEVIKVDVTWFGLILTVIVSAIALIASTNSKKTSLLALNAGTTAPETFVNREKQISKITELVSKGNVLIDIYGITGIGVTCLLHFIVDLYNGKLPIKTRHHYGAFHKTLRKGQCRAFYKNIGKVTCSSELLIMVRDSLLINACDITSTPALCQMLNSKLKSNSNLVLCLDGVQNWEQMKLIEDFAVDYLSIRSKDTIVFGAHQCFLTHELKYEGVEISKFQQDHISLLAEMYDTVLDDKSKIKLYEITDGIPMLVALFLAKGDLNAPDSLSHIKDVYSYIMRYLIDSLEKEQLCILEKIAWISLSVSEITKYEIELLGLDSNSDALKRLVERGLINRLNESSCFVINKVIARCVIINSTVQNELCEKLYLHYKQVNKSCLAVMYLLLSKRNNTADINYIKKFFSDWLENSNILEMLMALEPTIDFADTIKTCHPEIYTCYLYQSVYALSSCGNYTEAKDLLGRINIDGDILQSYRTQLNQDNFNLHFIWADVEHLLNNYSKAIEIINALIDNCLLHTQPDRLPQLFWMKAHCLRHQALDLNFSFEQYEQAKKLAIEQNKTEYIIRTLHGEICISLIRYNATFDFEAAFGALDAIYSIDLNKWKSYQYNTCKYKAIYHRVLTKSSQETVWDELNKALEGFKSIRKRNIYDVHFEFGEYYRYYKEFDKSKESYGLCVEFARHNTDYNLESLAQLGLILVDIEQNKTYQEDALLEIISRAREKDLNLSELYARKILEASKTNNKVFSLLLFNP